MHSVSLSGEEKHEFCWSEDETRRTEVEERKRGKSLPLPPCCGEKMEYWEWAATLKVLFSPLTPVSGITPCSWSGKSGQHSSGTGKAGTRLWPRCCGHDAVSADLWSEFPTSAASSWKRFCPFEAYKSDLFQPSEVLLIPWSFQKESSRSNSAGSQGNFSRILLISENSPQCCASLGPWTLCALIKEGRPWNSSAVTDECPALPFVTAVILFLPV